MTYKMPNSTKFDSLFFNKREYKFPFANAPTSGALLNVGIGQFFLASNSYPLWVRKSYVKPITKALLLVERAEAHGVQSTYDVAQPYGYGTHRPGMQIQFIPASQEHGYPVLHSRAGRERGALFNYLFCDGHVDLLNPRETTRDPVKYMTWANYGGDWEGADMMWTIRPDYYVK